MREFLDVVGFAGTPSDREWSQVVVVHDNNQFSVAIAVSLKIKSEAGLVSLPEIGIRIIEEAKMKLQRKKLMELGEIKSVVASLCEGVGDDISFDFAVVVGFGEIVVARIGEVETILIRGGKKHSLLGSGKIVEGIRGQVQEDDCFVIESKAMGALGVAIKTAREYREMLTATVHESDSSLLWGMIVSKVTDHTAVADRQVAMPYIGVRDNSVKYRNIGLGLFVFLLATVFIGAWRRQGLVAQQRVDSVVAATDAAHSQVMNVITTDPERARKIIAEARLKIEEFRSLAKGKDLVKAGELLDELARYEKEVFKQNEVTMLTFAELGLLNLDSSPKQMVVSNKGTLYFVDKERVAGISTVDKSQLELAIPFNPAPLDFAFVGENIYTMDDGGINGGVFANKASLKNLATPDEAWQSPSRIGVFGSSLYVLDIGTGEISKYAIIDGGLSSRKRWFGAGIMLDLSKIVDMVVDGDVWLVSSSGKLEKYSRGAPAKFEMEGFANENGEKKFADPIAVATTDMEVFVLERGKGRVVVFDRDGRYLRQYLNSQFGEGKDLVVWEGKGYILTEKEIKVFGL